MFFTAIPNQTEHKIFHAKLSILVSHLPIIGPVYAPQYWGNVKVNNTLPYDNNSGGNRSINEDFFGKDGIPSWYLSGSSINDKFAFIPATSALGLKNVSPSTIISSYLGSNYPIVHNSSICPFDIVFAPDIQNNESHVEINSDILVSILKDNISPDNIYLQNKTITEANAYEARNTIITGNNITNNNVQGDFILENSGHVSIRAGERIVLKKGTHIKPKPGGSFRAYLGDFCPPYSPAKMLSIDNEENYSQDIVYNNTDMIYNLIKESENTYKIFPNPATNNINVVILNANKTNKLSIYNITGTLVKSEVLESKENVIKISNLPKGIYIF